MGAWGHTKTRNHSGTQPPRGGCVPLWSEATRGKIMLALTWRIFPADALPPRVADTAMLSHLNNRGGASPLALRSWKRVHRIRCRNFQDPGLGYHDPGRHPSVPCRGGTGPHRSDAAVEVHRLRR